MKRRDVATLKALLIEANASQEKYQEILEKEIPKQEEKIKQIEEKLKTSQLKVLVVMGVFWVIMTDLLVNISIFDVDIVIY